MATASEIIAAVCLGWYVFIILVCTIGTVQLFRLYSKPPPPSVSSRLPDNRAPHVTIIRPCKGLEPYLYECLASSLQQDYPAHKITVYFCVSTRDDPACSTIRRLLAEYSQHNAKLFIEEEDPALAAETSGLQRLGPNPKIRNMSRAYREAKGDIVWILDCNVWVGHGVCGRMVDRLCGYSLRKHQRPYKFVHHLPVAVEVPPSEAFHNGDSATYYPRPAARPGTGDLGGRLDEMFLSTAHAKMYTAINAVAVAPCICGKSSMFRRSHLNALTNTDDSIETRFGSGIDYFSENICEDHLIGDLLWKAAIPSTMPTEAKQWKNHGLVWGDIALQPVSSMSISNYTARRVRWLRVRKFTVPLATLVEPGTESFVCSLIGAIGLTSTPLTKEYFGDTWTALLVIWLSNVFLWATADSFVYSLLQSGKTVEQPSTNVVQTPPFVHSSRKTWLVSWRRLLPWVIVWLSREALTLPVWTWAIWGGVTVTWRDKKFWVGLDMKVHAMDEGTKSTEQEPLLTNARDLAGHVEERSSQKANGSKVRQD